MATRALVEGFLGGLRYPATPAGLAAAAREAGGSGEVLAALARLRAPLYGSANEVGEELFPVEPGPAGGKVSLHAESGSPPGGERYVSRERSSS